MVRYLFIDANVEEDRGDGEGVGVCSLLARQVAVHPVRYRQKH